jgi:hypothetical protein
MFHPNAPNAMPHMGMPVAHASSRFPNGIGITDRPQPVEDSCGCPPCYCCMCCSRPIFYTDASRQNMSEMVEWKHDCDGFHIDNANIMGNQLSFKGRMSCCSCTQYVDVTEGGRKIGHVALYNNCKCSQTVMAEAFDADGVSKFARIDNPCNPLDHFTGDHCGWGEHNWPLVWTPNQAAGPIAHITYRRHCCSGCYPTWTGIRRMPAGAPPDDEKLLLAMIHGRFWRTEQEENSENGQSQ